MDMKTYILRELTDLTEAAEYKGAELFFEYAPHVDKVFVRLYRNGFDRGTPDLSIEIFVAGQPYSEKAALQSLQGIKETVENL